VSGSGNWSVRVETSEALFRVTYRDPETGVVEMMLREHLTALRVAKFLATGPLDTYRLVQFTVQDEKTQYIRTAEQFLEDNPELAVIGAWQAGGSAARKARQDQIHEYWPNLGMALDALVVAHEA
jgi:hypothetical protein